MVVWSEENVVHLLNRAGFGAKPNDIKGFLRRGVGLSVEILVSQKPTSAKGPSAPTNERSELKKLSTWWAKRMATQNARRLQEKMVLFWHDHFATQFSVAKSVRRMSYQNRTFREHGLGPLRTLVWEVTRDPAMLEMLDGRQNRKNALNENFARELMELFVLGVFSFDETEENYTQTDVTELTRALTGFQYDANDVGFFNLARWDSGSKTLFAGKPFQATGPIGVEDGAGNLLPPAQNAIDILFTHTDSAGNLTMPRFLGKKLWEYFAYPNPDAALIDEITTDFRANGYVVRDLLRSLFTHDEFYSATAKTSSVKNPCEFLFSAMRALDAQSSHVLTPDKLEDMGMELFEPPSVNGWSSGPSWLSSGQLVARFDAAQAVGAGRSATDVKLKPEKLIPKGAVGEDEVVDEILARLGIAAKTPSGTRQALIDYFEGMNDFEDEEVLEKKVRGAVALALQIPEASIH
ncbi:MAG: DUF1800 domain-containing protein [Deltaproteobacteria bacterium]|nr:DUF1800 domain-containing protein [Deltaproteobacteria bacterium]